MVIAPAIENLYMLLHHIGKGLFFFPLLFFFGCFGQRARIFLKETGCWPYTLLWHELLTSESGEPNPSPKSSRSFDHSGENETRLREALRADDVHKALKASSETRCTI